MSEGRFDATEAYNVFDKLRKAKARMKNTETNRSVFTSFVLCEWESQKQTDPPRGWKELTGAGSAGVSF